MQLTQIGKILELSPEAESFINAEQRLIEETEEYSFADALDTSQFRPKITEDDQYSHAVIEEDKVHTDENLDPILYLQQFLPLDDKHTAEAKTEVLPKSKDITKQNTTPANDKSDLTEQAKEAALDESERAIKFSDTAKSVLTPNELIDNPQKKTHTESAPLEDIHLENDTDKESFSSEELEIPSPMKTKESTDKINAQDDLGQKDAEQLQTLGLPKLTSHDGLEDQNDANIIKPSGTENLSAPKMTENNTGSRLQAPEFNINTSVHQDDWGDEFNQRILWLGQQKIDKAFLQLHPKDLGPVQVQIQMQDNQAFLQIQVADAQVGQRIQDSLPELRALLQMQGLGLGQASIDSQNRGQQGGEQSQSGKVDFESAIESTPSVRPERVLGITRDGHIDTYA